MNWKPIETAPKDGREILVATKDGQIHISHWIGWQGGFYAGGDSFGAHVWTDIGGSALSHWMPLPLPPKKDAMK